MDEILRYVIPILTFGLGVLFVPHVEKMKSRVKAKENYESLILEVGEEIDEIPNRLRKMADCLISLNQLKNTGEPIVGKPSWYVPRDVTIYFLKETMSTSFNLFDKDQRYAAKSLVAQVDGLNSYSSSIKKTPLSKENLEILIKEYKRFLYTGCCMLNTMRVIVKHEAGVFEKSDEYVISSIFSELNIDLTIEDLKITASVNFN